MSFSCSLKMFGWKQNSSRSGYFASWGKIDTAWVVQKYRYWISAMKIEKHRYRPKKALSVELHPKCASFYQLGWNSDTYPPGMALPRRAWVWLICVCIGVTFPLLITQMGYSPLRLVSVAEEETCWQCLLHCPIHQLPYRTAWPDNSGCNLHGTTVTRQFFEQSIELQFVEPKPPCPPSNAHGHYRIRHGPSVTFYTDDIVCDQKCNLW